MPKHFIENPSAHTLYMRAYRDRHRKKIKAYDKKYYEANRERINAQSIAWKRKNKKHVREDHWRAQGIDLTHEQYEVMLRQQRYRCGICRTHVMDVPQTYGLVVDHNHNTGKVRGLLCQKCNHGLGEFKDSLDLLHKATKYLKETDK